MLLDHVAQFAEVVDQQTLTTLIFVVLLQRLQQVADHLFEFALLDFQSDRERALNRQCLQAVRSR